MRFYKRETGTLRYVQLYGERNSATTYFRKILQDNMGQPDGFLGALQSEETPLGHKTFGYKHWFVSKDKLTTPQALETLFIVIYRNPYTWVRAMMERPYALEKSIGGEPLKALTGIKLTGHMKGRDTVNEFDPETGDKLTLFELRKRKIENFEAIKATADNVAYVNLETLVRDPDFVMTHLAQQFPTAFARQLSVARKPYKQLVRELEAPERFKPTEAAILNDAINWRWERAIGYAPDSYNLGRDDRTEIVILHGGSSSGKSFSMQKVAEISRDFLTLEMDACKYWEKTTPVLSLKGLRRLLADATSDDLSTIRTRIGSTSPKKARCVNYLFAELASMLAAPGIDGAKSRIIATCGALPMPGAPHEDTLYGWLEERLPIVFRHVLLDVPPAQHEKQIEARKRTHLKSDIDDLHSRMVAKRHLFDSSVPDFSGVAAFLGIPTQVPRSARIAPAAAKAPVRIKRRELSHIQIYGERSSGTKYLTSLVSQNMIAPENVLGSYASKTDPVNKAKRIGYEHYYPNLKKLAQYQHDTLFLVIHKNPYTWIRSMLGKPYHFKGCLEGKGITDLPGLKLAGFDIHGREIPDVHPETGARLTMFELRAHKILAWEKLASHVDNVVYINYEHLLMRPTAILQAITDAFPSLFADTRAPQLVPDPHYVSKYATPKPFESAEIAILDAHIDWEAEAIVGYRRGNLFI